MITNPYILLLAFPPVAYLVGSISFAILIARLRGVDLRTVGSGNPGATNVARALGRRWGYLCFFLDVGKGLVPTLAVVLLTRPLDGRLQQFSWMLTGCGAILGHVFPFWLGFRGGKGVATSLGVVLGIFPYMTVPGLLAFAVWIVVTLISRYVSLGSLVAALGFLAFFVLFNFGELARRMPLLVFSSAMVLLIVIRHRANIRRLLGGTESKIGQKGAGHPAMGPGEES